MRIGLALIAAAAVAVGAVALARSSGRDGGNWRRDYLRFYARC